MLRLITLALIKRRRLQQITMFQIEKPAGPVCRNSGKFEEIGWSLGGSRGGSRGPRSKSNLYAQKYRSASNMEFCGNQRTL